MTDIVWAAFLTKGLASKKTNFSTSRTVYTREGSNHGRLRMSLIKRLFGRKGAAPNKRVHICVECGMPVAEHKDWCAILKGQQAMLRAATPAKSV